MDSTNNSKKPLIKRRNFFYLLGASVIGAVAIYKSPLKFLGSKLNKSIGVGETAKKPIVVKENPYAVKRETRSVKNG